MPSEIQAIFVLRGNREKRNNRTYTHFEVHSRKLCHKQAKVIIQIRKSQKFMAEVYYKK